MILVTFRSILLIIAGPGQTTIREEENGVLSGHPPIGPIFVIGNIEEKINILKILVVTVCEEKEC